MNIADFIDAWPSSFFARTYNAPWLLTTNSISVLQSLIRNLESEYRIRGDIAVHKSAAVEDGAVLKGPIFIGPRSFVASTAYLRGGVYLGADCSVGPACEIKSSFLFPGSKVAHLSFVGDCLIGSDVNIEAGAIFANYRNELAKKTISIQTDNGVIETGVEKFGALVGDNARIGANSTIAPGVLIKRCAKIPRMSHFDQYPGRTL